MSCLCSALPARDDFGCRVHASLPYQTAVHASLPYQTAVKVQLPDVWSRADVLFANAGLAWPGWRRFGAGRAERVGRSRLV